METQHELYLRLEKAGDHESHKLFFELKMNTLKEMCERYNKKREDISAYTGFIESIIEFYIKTGYLTEKQLNAFKKWKTISYRSGYDGQMSDLDLAFWGANNFGDQ